MATRKPNSSADVANSAVEGYTVLARRYRPQQFDQLIGQDAIVRSLVNAIKADRVAHAYLFTGARGVGKTSIARILAKALNCKNGPTVTPCDKCDACTGIATGEDVDVLEIDGASNRGIDEVRAIRENIQYRPSRARYKIYIIDEVHMLTPPAFNALLKTLEEPPPHVKFFLATTEAQKIPITILSRCQRFDLAGIGHGQIVDRLKDIVAGEKVEADDDALDLLARRAGGSMRDAQSLLDQLLAFAEDRLTIEQVHRLLGTANEDRVLELGAAILERDAAKALRLLGLAADEGLLLGELLEQLIAYWRDLMVVNCGGVSSQILSVAARHREVVSKQARGLSLDTILAGLDVLNMAKFRLRTSAHGRMVLEMALVRLARMDDLLPISQLAQWVRQAPPSSAGALASPVGVSPPEREKKKAATPPDQPEQRPVTLCEETLPPIWRGILGKFPPVFAGFLEKAGLPAISGPNSLAIRFPSSYTQEQEYCGEPARIARLEAELFRVIGHRVHLRVEQDSNGPANAFAANQEGHPAPPARRRRAEGPLDPLTIKAMATLEAQILQREEGFGIEPDGTGVP
jgi:DNA polymerase III subunit gamma/tau